MYRSLPKTIFVFDEQYGFAGRDGAEFDFGVRLDFLDDVVDSGEIYSERCSDADLTFDLDLTAALLNDTVYSRESKARSLTVSLRREERFEDAGQSFIVHTDAHVGDG